MFKITLCVSASLLFFCVMFPRHAKAQEPISIRIGQSSLTDVQVASIVTARAGIFNKYGLSPRAYRAARRSPDDPGSHC